jgi:acetyl esterase/lipase
MKTERIYLHNFTDKVYLDVFLCDDSPSYSHHTRPFMLVCPGGGYGALSPREAEPIARRYMGYGFNTAILYYTINNRVSKAPLTDYCATDKETGLPLPLIEVATAISTIRENAESWNTNPEQIAVIGFSAGAHLAGMSGILWNKPELLKKLGKDNNRPDAMLLIYPVASAFDNPHKGSFINLLDNDDPSEQLLNEYSLEKQVNDTTPPTFLFHTEADKIVPCENSLTLARSLKENNVNFELHILPELNHGISLAEGEVWPVAHPYNARWVEWSILWLKTIFNIFAD